MRNHAGTSQGEHKGGGALRLRMKGLVSTLATSVAVAVALAMGLTGSITEAHAIGDGSHDGTGGDGSAQGFPVWAFRDSFGPATDPQSVRNAIASVGGGIYDPSGEASRQISETLAEANNNCINEYNAHHPNGGNASCRVIGVGYIDGGIGHKFTGAAAGSSFDQWIHHDSIAGARSYHEAVDGQTFVADMGDGRTAPYMTSWPVWYGRSVDSVVEERFRTHSPENMSLFVIVVDKDFPETKVKPQTDSAPKGRVAAGKQDVSDTTTFVTDGGGGPTAVKQDGTMTSWLHYRGGRFLGHDIPAETGALNNLTTGYRNGDSSVTQKAGGYTVLPGSYYWDTAYSAGTDPDRIQGSNDQREQFSADAPPVATKATTSMVDKPSWGTNKATTDRINADIVKDGAVKDILDAMHKYGIPTDYTLKGTDQLCYVPTATELKQLPQRARDLIGKGDPANCKKGILSKGGAWSSSNGAPTSVTVKPTDLDESITGWTPGQYYFVLKIANDPGAGITGGEVIGNHPDVRDEQVTTPVYGYTQQISTDKDLSNKDGVIIAGSDETVYDYITTNAHNNSDQSNGDYWTPESNPVPSFTARLTLNYIPDEKASRSGLGDGTSVARSVTKRQTLKGYGANQRSQGFTPGDLGMSVWASGLYYMSIQIRNQDNKDVARQCGPSGDTPCMQNEQSIEDSYSGPGQVVVSRDPTADDGSGWVPDGTTTWNEKGLTEPLTKPIRQTYENGRPVMTANDKAGNVSTDLHNSKDAHPDPYGRGSILLDEMESFYAVYPQWQMRDFLTQQSFDTKGKGKVGVIQADNGGRAHDRLIWKATPVDSAGDAMQGADGGTVNLPALAGMEPVDLDGTSTLNYTPAAKPKNTLKAGSQSAPFTIRNATGTASADVPAEPDFSPGGFSKATGQARQWKVWEPGTYCFNTDIDATQENFLHDPVHDVGDTKDRPGECFIVDVDNVSPPDVTTVTRGPGTWQDELTVKRPANGWDALAGADFWDLWVTSDAMGATYASRLDHNDNVLQTDQANNPAPGQRADGDQKGDNGKGSQSGAGTPGNGASKANPTTDGSVTRIVDGTTDGSAVSGDTTASNGAGSSFHDWNWTGTALSPRFTYKDFRPGTGSTVAKAEDSWKAPHSGTYWFETTANYQEGRTPGVDTVAKLPPAVGGQSASVKGDYTPMGAMDPYTIDNVDGTKLTLGAADLNANDRDKDEYHYDYTPTVLTHVSGVAQQSVAGAGPDPKAPVVDKITTANSGMPVSQVYNATLTLNYSSDLPADDIWAAGAVTRVDSSVRRTIALHNDQAGQTPEGDRFVPSDFGWDAWKAGTYWFSLSVAPSNSQETNGITDMNLDNSDAEEYFLMTEPRGDLTLAKTGRVTGADGSDKGQTFNKVGDRVRWSIKVTNTGRTTEDFSLREGGPSFTGSGKLGAVSCPATRIAANQDGKGRLAPGESATCTTDYTITQKDMDNPEWDILNTVSASWTGEDGSKGEATSNGSLVSQTGGTGARLTVGKTVDKVLDTAVPDDKAGSGVVRLIPRDHAERIPADAKGAYAVSAGDTVDYNLTVTNSGDHTLHNLALSDPLVQRQLRSDLQAASNLSPDTDIHCPAGALGEGSSLAVGASIVCTASYTVTQQDIDAGRIANIATATAAQESGSAVTDDGALTTPVAGEPALTDTKTSDHDGRNYKVGDVIKYTVKSQNTGNTTLHDVSVKDPDKPGDWNGHNPLSAPSCRVHSNNVVLDGNVQNDVDEGPVENGKATLPPGDYLLCESTTTVTQADVDGSEAGSNVMGGKQDNGKNTGEVDYSQLVNTACSAGVTPGKGGAAVNGTCATDTVISPTSPAIKAVKTADTSYVQKAGQKVHYTITLTNTGNVTLHDVFLGDYLPGISDVSCGNFKLASDPGAYDSDALAPGAVVTCTADYTVTQHDIDTGSDYDIKAKGDPADWDPATNPSGHATDTSFDEGNAKDWANGDEREQPSLINVACVSFIGPHGESVNPHCIGHTIKVGTPPAVGDGQALDLTKAVRLASDGSKDDEGRTKDLGTGWSAGLSNAGSVLSVSGLNAGDEVEAVTDGGKGQRLTADAKGAAKATLKPAAKADSPMTVTDLTTGTTLFAGWPSAADGSIIDGELAKGAARDAKDGWQVVLGNRGTAVIVTGLNPGDGVSASSGAKGAASSAVADSHGTARIGLQTPAAAGDYLTVVDTTTGTTLFDAFPSKDGRTVIDGLLAQAAQGETIPSPPAGQQGGRPGSALTVPAVGTRLVYTTTALNNGRLTLRDVSVSDTARTGFTGTGELTRIQAKVVKADDKDGFSRMTDADHAQLAVGAKLVITAEYTVTQADMDAGSLTNTAVASGRNMRGDPPFSSKPATVTTPMAQNPKLGLKKTSDFDGIGYQAGQAITYSFVVTNEGNTTLDTGSIEETAFNGSGLLSHVMCGERSGAGGQANGSVTLAPGQRTTCTAQYTAQQADVDRGNIRNAAVAKAQTPRPTQIGVSASDDDTLTAVPDGPAGLTFVKTLDPSTPSVTKAGDKVGYLFTVVNTGGRRLTGVQIHDALLEQAHEQVSCPASEVAKGASIVCHATHTTTQADIDRAKANGNRLPNDATVATSQGVGGESSVDVPLETPAPAPKPAITVRETISPRIVTQTGQQVTMGFTITNAGDTTLRDVGLSDPLFQDGDYRYGTSRSNPTAPANGHAVLAPGESIVATAVHTVTQADLDAGVIHSPVTATGRYAASAKGLSARSADGADVVKGSVSAVTDRLVFAIDSNAGTHLDDALANGLGGETGVDAPSVKPTVNQASQDGLKAVYSAAEGRPASLAVTDSDDHAGGRELTVAFLQPLGGDTLASAVRGTLDSAGSFVRALESPLAEGSTVIVEEPVQNRHVVLTTSGRGITGVTGDGSAAGSDTGKGDGSDTGKGDGSDTGKGDGSDTGKGNGSDTGKGNGSDTGKDNGGTVSDSDDGSASADKPSGSGDGGTVSDSDDGSASATPGKPSDTGKCDPASAGQTAGNGQVSDSDGCDATAQAKPSITGAKAVAAVEHDGNDMTSGKGVASGQRLPKDAKAGDVVVYQFSIVNDSKLTLYSVQARDMLGGVSAIRLGTPMAAPGGQATPQALPDLPGIALAPGQEVDGLASYTLTQDDVDRGTLTNTVEYTGVSATGVKAEHTAQATNGVGEEVPAINPVTGMMAAAREKPWTILLGLALIILGLAAAGALVARSRKAGGRRS